MESKFINKQTIQFLKAKAGATTQQQLKDIRERIEGEAKDLDQMARLQVTDRAEFTGKIDAIGKALLNIQNELTSLNNTTGRLNYREFLAKQVQEKMSKKIGYLTLGLVTALIGVVVCLIRSLI